MNASLQSFTPAACWPAALGILGVSNVPRDPAEGTSLLGGFLGTMKRSAIRDLAHEVAREITKTNIEINYDDCYVEIANYFSELAAKAADR